MILDRIFRLITRINAIFVQTKDRVFILTGNSVVFLVDKIILGKDL